MTATTRHERSRRHGSGRCSRFQSGSFPFGSCLSLQSADGRTAQWTDTRAAGLSVGQWATQSPCPAPAVQMHHRPHSHPPSQQDGTFTLSGRILPASTHTTALEARAWGDRMRPPPAEAVTRVAVGLGEARAGRSSGQSRPGMPGEDGHRVGPFVARGCQHLDVGSPGLRSEL